MKQTPPKPAAPKTSDESETERSKEYDEFENAVRRIMQQDPDEAEMIRKRDGPKKNRTNS